MLILKQYLEMIKSEMISLVDKQKLHNIDEGVVAHYQYILMWY